MLVLKSLSNISGFFYIIFDVFEVGVVDFWDFGLLLGELEMVCEIRKLFVIIHRYKMNNP